MVSKYYKEIKVDSIYDIKVGDIVFFKNNAFGIVIKKGKTILHSHKFIIIKAKYQDSPEFYTDKWYNQSLSKNAIVLRSIFEIKHKDFALLGSDDIKQQGLENG